MKITAYTYRFPFLTPFRAGNTVYEYRKGILLKLQEDAITAYGEAAPLPGFSPYETEDVWTQLKACHSGIRDLLQSNNPESASAEFYQTNGIKPSLQFALDTLMADWASQKKGQPLASYLFKEHSHSVPLNGVVGWAGKHEMIDRSRALIEAGYRTLKFKMGEPFDDLLAVLGRIREEHPELTLRVDANGSWSLKEAKQNLAHLQPLNIDYCEEPLEEISPEKLSELNQETGVPIALDETIIKTERIEPLLPYLSVAVLKPMLIGSLSNLFATKTLLDSHEIRTIFTSSLESGIGRMMTATLASGLGAKQTAHGLATGGLFTMDVWEDGTYINRGNFILPDAIGLGKRHKPDFENIATLTFEIQRGK